MDTYTTFIYNLITSVIILFIFIEFKVKLKVFLSKSINLGIEQTSNFQDSIKDFHIDGGIFIDHLITIRTVFHLF
jgi:hypothetical protein